MRSNAFMLDAYLECVENYFPFPQEIWDWINHTDDRVRGIVHTIDNHSEEPRHISFVIEPHMSVQITEVI